jgi:outer membrane protein assembly factor BamB
MPEMLGVRQHDGAHCSILLHGDLLYVCTSNGLNDEHRKIDAPDVPALVVFDKRTGRLVARDDEHMAPMTVHSTWSSPSLADVNGRTLVFFGGGNGVCYAFDALTSVPPEGAVKLLNKVWQFDCDPTAPKTNIHSFKGNRRVSASNIIGMPVFDRDRIYVVAGGDLWWGKRKSWLKCIDATQTGDITRTGGVWSYEMPYHSMATPSVAGDLAFIADCRGNIHCLDRETGRAHWVHEGDSETWGSTMVVDGKVYLGTRRGDLWVFAAEKEKNLLAKLPLGSPISGSVTAANGALYVATMKQLFAVRQGR